VSSVVSEVGLPATRTTDEVTKVSSGRITSDSYGRGRSATTGTARCQWKLDGRTRSRNGISGLVASGAGTHRIDVGPTGVSRGRKSPACGRRPETRRFEKSAGQRQEGQVGREVRPAAWEGKPLKGKPQRRHRRETKPEGCREERSVKRLRKPVDAAQPGQANPVLVAS
jgi:hypothetical protein